MMLGAARRRVGYGLLAAVLAVGGCAHGPDEARTGEAEPGEEGPGEAGPGDAGPGEEGPGAGEPVRTEVAPDLAGSARVFEEARQRGVDFRAVGQEPGWLLEIDDGGSLRFAYDYGASEVVVPTPAPAPDGGSGRTTYVATTAAHELQVVIERTACADTMSGEAFEARVEVVLDRSHFSGCGRWLGD